MSYYTDTLEGHATRPRPLRQRRWQSLRAPQKFTRLEPLEGRVLFDAAALDPLFGVGGRSRIDVTSMADRAAAVYALPDGKVLVAGNATYGLDASLHPLERAFVARLNADGSLDAMFGNGGFATYPQISAPIVTHASAITVSPDGRIFVGGSAPAAPSSADPAFAVAAFTADGLVDTTFGTSGVAVADMLAQRSVTDAAEWVESLAVQPDGKIVAVGRVGTVSDSGTSAGVVRFDSAGAVDPSFAPQVELLTTGTWRPAAAVALQPDGRIVVAENRGSGASTFAVKRYNTDGTPDAAFGAGGRVTGSVPGGLLELWVVPGPEPLCDVEIQPDGRIVVAGRATGSTLGLLRYNPDGTLDTTFGGAGSVVVTTGPLADVDVRIESDGGLTVATVGSWGLAAIVNPPLGTSLQAYVARLNASGGWLGSSRVKLPATSGAEQLAAVTLLPDGKLLAGGVAYPTVNHGEGVAWDQSADALLVRFDPATFAADADAQSAGAQVPPAGDGLTFGVTPPAQTPDPAPVFVTKVIDSRPPVFTGASVVRRGRFYKFKLGYTDAAAARTTTVGVYGPTGALVAPAKLLKVRRNRDRTQATTPIVAVASYRVAAPGGRFDAGDNGQYAVRLGAATTEPFGQLLGQFIVAAKAARVRNASALVRLTVEGLS